MQSATQARGDDESPVHACADDAAATNASAPGHDAGSVPVAMALRYHALDALRGAMMLLGIYLHVVVAYAPIGGWPFKQAELTNALNVTVLFIHIFRMPLFYVLAGFFAALLYERRGLRAAAANRAGRILVPFLVGWAVLFPLVVGLAAIGKGTVGPTIGAFVTGAILQRLHPMHLWFLEYLLVLYGLALIAVPLVSALPAGLRAGLNQGFRAIVQSPSAPLWLALPSFAALLPMRWPGLDDPPSFVPALRIVAAYAIPFGFGFALYRNADLLEILRRRAWPMTLAAALASIAYTIAVYGFASGEAAFFVSRALHSLALWCLILGVTGLFLRYLGRPSRTLRYLCDASYFLYLAHMPVVMVFQLLLVPLALPPLLKIAIVLVAATATLLALYHVAVRPTFIGAALNGRRVPPAVQVPVLGAAAG